MKALSIKQPWAGMILSGQKEVENRSWRTGYRGDLVIHASMAIDIYAPLVPLVNSRIPLCGGLCGIRGMAMGIVNVFDCVQVDECQLDLAYGPWCWLLRNPRIFTRPIPIRGSLRLFDVSDDLIRQAEPIPASQWLNDELIRRHERALEMHVERTGQCPD